MQMELDSYQAVASGSRISSQFFVVSTDGTAYKSMSKSTVSNVSGILIIWISPLIRFTTLEPRLVPWNAGSGESDEALDEIDVALLVAPSGVACSLWVDGVGCALSMSKLDWLLKASSLWICFWQELYDGTTSVVSTQDGRLNMTAVMVKIFFKVQEWP